MDAVQGRDRITKASGPAGWRGLRKKLSGRRMTATALIGRTTAVISPYRVAEIERAGIGQGTGRGACDRTDGSTGTGIAGNCADRSACTRAEKTTAHRAIARIRCARGKHERRNERRRKDETALRKPFSLK